MTIDPEATGEVLLTVTPAETAARGALETGEAFPEVFATACMVREMERAAAKLMRPLLGPGQLSVGVRVEVSHIAPTPVSGSGRHPGPLHRPGGQALLVRVWSEDGGGTIGKGRHARAVVEEARLLDAAEARR